MNAFNAKLRGTLYGLVNWSDWDRLRARIRAGSGDRWFAYAVGMEVPEAPLPHATLGLVLDEIDGVLRRDHRESYLGIVYVDDPGAPTLVKIYDPNQLGSSCGGSGFEVPPGWVLSRDPPEPILSAAPPSGSRRRWWEAIFSLR